MSAALNVFQQVEAKRKSWTPINPTENEKVKSGAEDTISRCLALRCLEIPVKEFIVDGLARKESLAIGEDGIRTLSRNILDEEKHDLAFNNCVKIYADYDSSLEKQAEQIRDAWLNHPDFPITKAAVLENGVFFVALPIYRLFGSSSMRTTAIDVSADEVGHVQSHRYAAMLTNFKPSRSLDKLRKDTVAWIVDKFNVPGHTKDKFIKASDDLMYRGITPQLEETKSYQVFAFFEKSNQVLPRYSA